MSDVHKTVSIDGYHQYYAEEREQMNMGDLKMVLDSLVRDAEAAKGCKVSLQIKVAGELAKGGEEWIQVPLRSVIYSEAVKRVVLK